MKHAVHICSWSSGLDMMPRKDQKFPAKVLRVLDASGIFSVFEASANPTIARVMTNLNKQGLIEIDNVTVGYPWSKVKLTAKGRAYLDTAP